ncbi:AMP-binding protein [Aquihabitans sp. G128]|uniref:class I adenylate-forming enzyme family protein n=1 Tax=Aquihabitans sp. G128 TaxID=2849779 RepID=UPI001C219F61|nr:AMP-binding protein [Aquihabitans sp. G128]QXC61677.1 AMP-binding protein [Aquihabitans sp. G128]
MVRRERWEAARRARAGGHRPGGRTGLRGRGPPGLGRRRRRPPRRPAPPRPGAQQLLAAARPHRVRTADGDRPGDPGAPTLHHTDALVIATSGTTGAPKLLVHTFDGLTAHARAVHAHLGVDADRDRWLACLPLAHLGGLGVVLRSLLTDTPVDVLPGFDAATVADAPRTLGTTLTSLVPTTLDRIDPSPYRWVVLGGSADPTVRPANVVHTYGLTETGGGIVYGGTPLPGAEVHVAADGAISLAGPMLARGRRTRDGTVVSLTDDQGWLATGDLGRWTAAGRLEVDGRADDLIVSGGENVWPATVEAALATHPKVAEVAVQGQPDPEWGQRVAAHVVPTDPADPPTLAELRAHAKATLPAHAAPRALVLSAGLPRTALGKVRRSALPT